MICTKCGHQVADGGVFCCFCGEKLDTAGQQVQPFYSQQNYSAVHRHPGEGTATGALVCGIVGLFLAGLILGIIAIVQGKNAKKLGYTGGKATAGIVLGIVDIVGVVFILPAYILLLTVINGSMY